MDPIRRESWIVNWVYYDITLGDEVPEDRPEVSAAGRHMHARGHSRSVIIIVNISIIIVIIISSSNTLLVVALLLFLVVVVVVVVV